MLQPTACPQNDLSAAGLCRWIESVTFKNIEIDKGIEMDNNNDLHQTSTHRRMIIKQTLQLLGLSTIINLLPVKNIVFSQSQKSAIHPKISTQKDFMKNAFKMKQIAIDSGDQAFGAIIVKQGNIVGFGPSKVFVNHDPTARAEIEAIRDACRNLKTVDLTGCELYSTSKPCRMCETAGYWANIYRFYFGANIVDGGAPQYSSC